MNQMFLGAVGLEVETLRVDGNDRIVNTGHPFEGKPGFERDFAEAQLELVTPVCSNSRDLYDRMKEMRDEARQILLKCDPPEYLWDYSNPPEYPGELLEAQFEGELLEKTKYREYLRGKYGIRPMLFSGVHYNFSFAPEALGDADGNDVYLNLARHLYANAFLPVLLMAASPVCDRGFFEDGASGMMETAYASIRCSERGYWNKTLPILDFSDVGSYIRSVRENISAGTIASAAELYLPVRIKSKWRHALECMDAEGVAYIEYRMLDVNPFEEIGISYEDLEFMHLFMIYLCFLPEEPFDGGAQRKAVEDVKAAALMDPPAELIERGKAVIRAMKERFAEESYTVYPYLDRQLEKLEHPEKRYAARVAASLEHRFRQE